MTEALARPLGTGQGVDRDDLLDLYRTMSVITATGTRAAAEVKAGRLKSAFYPVRGLEGSCAALGLAMRTDDLLVSTYRNLGDAVAKGSSLRRIMAEVYGKADGWSKGKGGPMHLHDPEVNYVTSTGVVGSGLPIAAGLGLSVQLSGGGRAVVTTFGDGSTSIGAFHEAMNLAGLWKLPVVFVCQNNGWAEHTPIEAYAASTDLAGRARAYAMATETVDGFDPIATAAVYRAALGRARAGGGPTFVEVQTYRLTGHSGSSDYSYMPQDVLAKATERDPAPVFRRLLLDAGVAADGDLERIDRDVADLVDDAFAFAASSPQPSSDQRYTDVFAAVGGRVPDTAEDADRTDGVPTGVPTQTVTMAVAMNQALDHAMARDDTVILLGEDIADPAGGVFKVTKGLSTKYGTDRVRATPIAETAIIGAAVGAALAGHRPVAEIMFMDFVAVCLDQITNHAAKLRYMSGGRTPVPITVRTTIGEQRFGAQHTQSLEAWFMHTPGIKVVMPSTAVEAKGLLASCIADDDPCLFVENIALAYSQKGKVPVEDYRIPLGVAAVKREGTDLTIVSWGAAVHKALAAADTLAAEGISAEVVDLRTLVPMDMPTILTSVEKTRRAMVVHDAQEFCGPGGEIVARVTEELFSDLLGPVRRLGAGYSPAPYGPSGLDYLPTPAEVVEMARELMA